MIWTDGITGPGCGRDETLSIKFCSIKGEFVSINIEADCGCVATFREGVPAKTHIYTTH
jgi:hypothetical protein